MFGREKRLAKIDAKYISGHSLYAHEKGTDVLFYEDRMQFNNMDITIPYITITRLGSQEDRHITKTRVFVTGVVGLFWKKKYRYTVIEYNDKILTNYCCFYLPYDNLLFTSKWLTNHYTSSNN